MVRGLVCRLCLFTARRYGIAPVGIQWIFHIQYSALHTTVWTAFAARRDHSSICGRYVTPDEAAMERAYNLTARQWEAWMAEAYRPSYNVAPSQRVPVLRVIRTRPKRECPR